MTKGTESQVSRCYQPLVRMSGIYIHVPFCRQACSYCDFYFLTRGELKDSFVEALVREICSYENSPFSGEKIETIYFGGGTPSLLRERQLEKIFEALHDTFQIDAEEVTMELNPDDVTPGYLELIRGFGVNRASMGIQSFQSEILTFMNRAHTSEEAIKALEALRSANFPSYTADLIYGNPGQTLSMLEEDLATLLSYSPPHVSAYSLTVESGTRLGKQVELGRIKPPEDEEVAHHFDLVREKLGDAGIQQYEVSNFSLPGKEAVHNSSYWSHKNYLGFGPSAHSFVWDDGGARRWNNARNLKRYLNEEITEIREEVEQLSDKVLAEERLMLGLRTKWGVSLANLRDRYNTRLNDRQLAWIESQQHSGNVIREEDVIRLSNEGLKIADLLIVDLLSKG